MTTNKSGFSLPPAPVHLAGAVKAWSEPVTIPTYLPCAPDKNPMFLEKRVYQGSSGKIYPLPFYDRIESTPVDHAWQALHIENEFIRVMILPQIGGRIHVAMDKTNGYDFVYRQNVIKPALVGLAGPWISGGIEFNWPQHHRPGTFMPADWVIENHDDGSVTIWLSQHDPLTRMKGMHGVCLHPRKSYLELKARLYNRTALMQTFLWWANVATRVHEQYQSFFPPDVYYVADHAKRATSAYPLCDGHYYGVDYAGRARSGVPANQMPKQFIPPGTYDANDLSWYANIPVPTSYMCMGTQEDFFGGYDHDARAGIVHVADHHVSPGKKQWTWGNHEFGYAWDRLLTDNDGPYIELMAGVFTDNQPDFSFLAPGETKSFSQFWYPIREIGPADHANVDASVRLRVDHGKAHIGVAVTADFSEAMIKLSDHHGREIKQWPTSLSPGDPFIDTITFDESLKQEDLILKVIAGDRIVISYQPQVHADAAVPPAATEAPEPEKISSIDELYLTGLHLEQYRHATRMPEPYWLEALKRDPLDSRCNTAMGNHHLRRGEFMMAEDYFRRATARLTHRNPNPAESEAYYGLGIALRFQDHDDDAYAAIYKSCWSAAWQSPGFLALAQLAAVQKRWPMALEHIDRSLLRGSDNLRARNLKMILLTRLGRLEEATAFLKETLSIDPLDSWARHLDSQTLDCDTQIRFDLALEYIGIGLFEEAASVLARADPDDSLGTAPMLHYYRAYIEHLAGRNGQENLCQAAQCAPDYCFPARLEEIAILQHAMTQNPCDAKAPYYLGNLFYDRKRYVEAIELWERSHAIDPTFSVVSRNLGIAYFNVLNDAQKARAAYESALESNPNDARLLYERDQLARRLGDSPAERLSRLIEHRELVDRRDDLSIEFCALLNQTGRHREAEQLISNRQFQPWEGGEGLAIAQHTRTHLSIGRQLLAAGDARGARASFEHASSTPHHLGEARHLLANCSDIHYWLGVACHESGDETSAKQHWKTAAEFQGDFVEMRTRAFSILTYYSAMAHRSLGQEQQASLLLERMQEFARDLEKSTATIDYFATSLPTMLLFNDDLQRRQTADAWHMRAMAMHGLGSTKPAQLLMNRVLEIDPSREFLP